MTNVISMEKIKGKPSGDIKWKYVDYTPKGEIIPLKVWENLKVLLDHHNIKLKLNDIDHEIYFENLDGVESNNGKITDIVSLQVREGLKMQRNEVELSVKRIAEENSFNPFVDMLKANENEDMKIIDEVFSCLQINLEYADYYEFFQTLFLKWCINVVKLAHNTLKNGYRGQGVLILQGRQGDRKSTFFEKLMPKKEFFKGDMSLAPDNKDSVIQNTKYILVEWGEIDSTLKGEQAKLKQFITATDDEFRASYARVSERYPRLTSYCGSVNRADFLKDETGSRRFWVIPVDGKCDIDKLESLDMAKFWGVIYHLWKQGEILDYLPPSEEAKLNRLNGSFNYETDTTIILNEKLDWDSDEEDWEVYNITEISDYLMIRDKKQLKNELEKKGLRYQSYRRPGRSNKKGFKIPRITVTVRTEG